MSNTGGEALEDENVIKLDEKLVVPKRPGQGSNLRPPRICYKNINSVALYLLSYLGYMNYCSDEIFKLNLYKFGKPRY